MSDSTWRRAGAALIRPVAICCLVALLGACSDEPEELTGNPFSMRPLDVGDAARLQAASAQAAADGQERESAVLERMAEVPAGTWLTPERYPPGQVGDMVASVVASAAGARLPVFVVYGIPDRDCTGTFSAGGLTPEAYGPWVEEIAEAAGGDSVVVLEPDALPSLEECGSDSQRIPLISAAVGSLAAAGVITYVDAGHSDWVPAPRMAELLRSVGIDRVRGFATNVSNYQPDANERAFAAELSGLLDGAHYVIDTSRNGDPDGTGQAVTDWCNPPGRSLGVEPGFVDDGSALDALLWVKPPAESDGTCHGGPPAGEVWIERAVELAFATGW